MIHITRYRTGDRGRGELAAAALFAGTMLTVKYSAYAAYPLLAAALVLPIFPKGERGRGWRDLPFFLAVSHTILIPWLVKEWIEMGNPLFPLFPSLLGGEGWDPVSGARLLSWQRSIGMGRDLVSSLLLPWNALFRSARGYAFFDGVLSPVILLWMFWSVVRGTRTVRLLLVLAVAGIYLWGAGSQQLRFLLPVVLLLSALIGPFWRSERSFAGVLQGALFLSVSFALLLPALVETKADTLPVLLGREEKEAYRARKVQPVEAWRSIERIVPEGETVLLVWENRVFHATRSYRADSFFEASRIVRAAENAGEPERFLRQWRESGIRWVLVNRPLQRVFSRYYPPDSIAILDNAWSRCEPEGSWKGLELYRIP